MAILLENIKDIGTIIAWLGSVSAIIYSYRALRISGENLKITERAIEVSEKTFHRLATVENENILYKKRLDNYTTISSEISLLFIILDKKIDEFYDEVESGKKTHENLMRISDEVFDITGHFAMKIYPEAVLLSKELQQAIGIFIDKLNDLEILDYDKIESFEHTHKLVSEIEPYVDKIEEAIRKDLDLEIIQSAFKIRMESSRRR